MKTFNQLPDHSRIWIYQSNKELSIEEVAKIKAAANDFISQWTSHGNSMDAAVEVMHARFVIVAVDEQTAPASGCGIDKSFRFIQDIEKQFNISLLNRMQVAYKAGDAIFTCSLKEFEELIAANKITENTLVFNNLVDSKAGLTSNWEVPLKESWHKRMSSK